MRGIQKHTIDAKNRLFVPAKYREELGTKVVITKTTTASSISVYSANNIGALETLIMQKLDFVDDYEARLWYFSNTEDAEIDSQGRLALPDSYIDHAKIEKNVISVGFGDHLEIWGEEAYLERTSGLGPGLVNAGLTRKQDK